MPKTAIRIPQVRKRRCQTGVIVLSLFALTMALSKLSEISSTERTATMKRTESVPSSVPVIAQPSQPPSPIPTAVKRKAQRK